MFENIITESNLDFNELENKVYEFICKLGCTILKELLEDLDNKIMELRPKELRNKGKRKSCIKTIMGVVEYSRRVYEEVCENEKKHRYLLDEKFNIYGKGKISENLMDKILNTAVQTPSYRKASNEIEQTTKVALSHEAIRTLTMYAGKEIEDSENEMVNLKKHNKLQKGEKEIPILFEEADGLWISLQGKDRKEQIERNKKEFEKAGKEYKIPKKVKSELKLHETYEGWSKDKRHDLINKTYIAGFMSSEEIRKIRDAKVYSKYKEEEIKYRVINGDGARWINKLAKKNTIRQKDKFHIHQEIIRDIEDKEEKENVRKMFENKEYDKINEYIEEIKYRSGGEEKTIKKLEKLQSYLGKDIKRYTDLIELPNAPEGIEYRNMGTMESQIFTVFSQRFKGRKAFSKKGATYLAKVSARYKENKDNVELKRIKKEVQKDKEAEYAEKYIKELEKNYKKNYDAYIATREKTKEGIKEAHTLKNYNINDFDKNVINPIKELIKFEESSEMTCWPTFYGAIKNYKNRKHS